MDTILAITAGNLLSAPVLFFVLGFAATLAGAHLALPDGAAKMMSVYLMLAIGFKGGVALNEHGLSTEAASVLLAGIALSALMPLIGHRMLGAMTALSDRDRVALAAHYGSISIVTFAAAMSMLASLRIEASGTMVAVAAAMETPAILTALYLIYRQSGATPDKPAAERRSQAFREVFLNLTIIILIGAFVIGMITGPAGLSEIKPFITDPFKGVLCLFLFELGGIAGRGIKVARKDFSPGLAAYAVMMPLTGAALAAMLAMLIGMGQGDATLFITLAASASYIAVPAAMRLAVPDARHGLAIGASLGVTFPFNLLVGLPLYAAIAAMIT